MDKIWYRNPSKSEVIGRCGGDEQNERPRRTDKSRTLTVFGIAIYNCVLQTFKIISIVVVVVIKNNNNNIDESKRFTKLKLFLTFVGSRLTNPSRAKFHNTLIRLRFNPIHFMQNYTYFKQFCQECLKQNI